MDIRETGQKIVKLRHNNKITQEELAEKIGVSSQAVSKWENGKNLPDIEHLMLIAKLFNVPYSFFIENENDEHLEYRSKNTPIGGFNSFNCLSFQSNPCRLLDHR